MAREGGAVSSRGSRTLFAAGIPIAGAFWFIAWLEPPPGHPVFMSALAVATAGYVAALVMLAGNAVVPRRALVTGIALALAWRAPLVMLPADPAADAVRYIWDARVQGAGLNPYEVRPDDVAVQWLHTDLTRQVDAAWLPTIYPPVAQLYFRAVAGIDESITAFRIAALVCDAAARVLAGGAVISGFLVAACLRRRSDVAAPHVWAWPMAVALVAAPVIYPWYIVWLIPFAMDRRAVPVWVWSLSVLAVYPTWHLRRLGGPFAVPQALLAIEFALPVMAAMLIAMRLLPIRSAGGVAHG